MVEYPAIMRHQYNNIQESKSGGLRLLSLDGGGIRGLVLVKLLSALQSASQVSHDAILSSPLLYFYGRRTKSEIITNGEIVSELHFLIRSITSRQGFGSAFFCGSAKIFMRNWIRILGVSGG